MMDKKRLQSRALKNLATMDLGRLTDQFLKLKHHNDFLSFKKTLNMGEYTANTYAVLLASKKALSAAECAFITKHPRTKIYSVLKWLKERGFIEDTNHRPSRFRAFPLKKAINNFLNNERDKLSNMEKKLKQIAVSIESARKR